MVSLSSSASKSTPGENPNIHLPITSKIMSTRAQRNDKAVRLPGIIFLAALQILSGLQLVFSAISSFWLAAKAHTPEIETELIARLPSWLSQLIVPILVTFGVVMLIIGIFSLLLARGYLRGSEKARVRGIRLAIIAIIIAILGIIVLTSRLDVSSPFLTIMFNLAVIIYLHRPKVRSYFRAHE